MNLPVPSARRAAVVAVTLLGTVFTPAPKARAGDDPVNDISRYCAACWRNARLPADRWTDCTQEVFARLLERVPVNDWPVMLRDEASAERRELVRAIDTVKKRTQRAKKYAAIAADPADRRFDPDRGLADDREAVARAASEVLSDRQRRIMALLADGWSVPEVAAELGTSPERVSDEKYKAIRKLRGKLGVVA